MPEIDLMVYELWNWDRPAVRTMITFSRKPVVDWFETSPKFMIDGDGTAHLDQILEQYKVVQHGVSMYFGSAEKPNRGTCGD